MARIASEYDARVSFLRLPFTSSDVYTIDARVTGIINAQLWRSILEHG
jgi:hypothetical protein